MNDFAGIINTMNFFFPGFKSKLEKIGKIGLASWNLISVSKQYAFQMEENVPWFGLGMVL